MKSKECTHCGYTKDLSLFPRNNKMTDGRHSWCNECHRNHRKDAPPLSEEQKKQKAIANRISWMEKEYGVSPEEYDVLYKKQGGQCCICRIKCELLCVDHDHITMVVRGLLCQKCNKGLGCFEDDKARMQEAINYLAKDRPKPTVEQLMRMLGRKGR